MAPISRLDKIYRRVILGRFFADGWGDPRVLDCLYSNMYWFSDRDSLLDKAGSILGADLENGVPYPIHVGKPRELKNGTKVTDGWFETPMQHIHPQIVPDCIRRANIQIISPSQDYQEENSQTSMTGASYQGVNWKGEPLKPLIIHLAGTGDHGFWRRRQFMARPLAAEHGITSILLENPFYGSRKPANQMRSALRNVADLYVMGACLIVEAFVLLMWARRQGFGPLGLTGISMGGHMACLGAAAFPEPVVLVPCISATTASVVFTAGVLAGSIHWSDLARRMDANEANRRYLDPDYSGIEHGAKWQYHPQSAASYTVDQYSSTFGTTGTSNAHTGGNSAPLGHEMPAILLAQQNSSNPKRPSSHKLSKPYFSSILDKLKPNGSSNSVIDPKRSKSDALSAMTGIMDDFTYLGYYSTPVDPTLITHVTAEHDAYIPSATVFNDGNTAAKYGDAIERLRHPAMPEVWPGSRVLSVPGGHIAAYLTQQGLFRRAIVDTLDRAVQKYYCQKDHAEFFQDSDSALETRGSKNSGAQNSSTSCSHVSSVI